MKYQLLRRLLTFHTAYNITNGLGQTVICADKRLVAFSSEYSVRQPDRPKERINLRQRYALGRPDYEVSQAGEWLAFVERRGSYFPTYDVELVNGDCLLVTSSLFGRRYQIVQPDRDTEPVATISRVWALRERYGVEVLKPGYEDLALAIALVIADSLRHGNVG